MNRSTYFFLFAFLSLFALLLLFSEQLSRLSVPGSLPEFRKAIDQPAVEKATAVSTPTVTKRNLEPGFSPVLKQIDMRRRLFGLGLFPHPVEIKGSANDRLLASSVENTLDNIEPVPIEPKKHVRSPRNVKAALRFRINKSLLTRTHSGKAHFHQLWLLREVGAFMSNLRAIAAGRFVHGDALAARRKGRWRREIQAKRKGFKDARRSMPLRDFYTSGPRTSISSHSSFSHLRIS
ncbi:MAG TPA: hypothetical protein VE242_12615 [Chthoniobacterales bacterium]|nr:hypothetical protein [Chthoniobacterales bacterium]